MNQYISLYAAYRADAERIDAAVDYAVRTTLEDMSRSDRASLDWARSDCDDVIADREAG